MPVHVHAHIGRGPKHPRGPGLQTHRRVSSIHASGHIWYMIYITFAFQHTATTDTHCLILMPTLTLSLTLGRSATRSTRRAAPPPPAGRRRRRRPYRPPSRQYSPPPGLTGPRCISSPRITRCLMWHAAPRRHQGLRQRQHMLVLLPVLGAWAAVL